jgi:hypothetical protein
VPGVWIDRWVSVAGLAVAVVAAGDKLCALVVLVVRAVRRPVLLASLLAGGIVEILRGPEPLWWKLARVVDDVGYSLGGWFGWLGDHPMRHPRLSSASTVPLTTWLLHPGWGWDSYQRQLGAMRAYGPGLLPG